MLATTSALKKPSTTTDTGPLDLTHDGSGGFEFEFPVKCPPPVKAQNPTCAKSPSTVPRPKVDAMLYIRSATPKRALSENTLSPPKSVKQRTEPPPTAAIAVAPFKPPPPCVQAGCKGGPVSVSKPKPPVPTSVLIVCSGTEQIDYPPAEPDISAPVHGCTGGASVVSPMRVDNQTQPPPAEGVTVKAATQALTRELAPMTPWGGDKRGGAAVSHIREPQERWATAATSGK